MDSNNVTPPNAVVVLVQRSIVQWSVEEVAHLIRSLHEYNPPPNKDAGHELLDIANKNGTPYYDCWHLR